MWGIVYQPTHPYNEPAHGSRLTGREVRVLYSSVASGCDGESTWPTCKASSPFARDKRSRTSFASRPLSLPPQPTSSLMSCKPTSIVPSSRWSSAKLPRCATRLRPTFASNASAARTARTRALTHPVSPGRCASSRHFPHTPVHALDLGMNGGRGVLSVPMEKVSDGSAKHRHCVLARKCAPRAIPRVLDPRLASGGQRTVSDGGRDPSLRTPWR